MAKGSGYLAWWIRTPAELKTQDLLQLAARLLMTSELARQKAEQQRQEKLWAVQLHQQQLWLCLQGLAGASAGWQGPALPVRGPFLDSQPVHTHRAIMACFQIKDH